jgi:hypothetical protein
MSDGHTGYSRLTQRLQFGLDMCQASLLTEGNLMRAAAGKTGRSFEACALRKIKIQG